MDYKGWTTAVVYKRPADATAAASPLLRRLRAIVATTSLRSLLFSSKLRSLHANWVWGPVAAMH